MMAHLRLWLTMLHLRLTLAQRFVAAELHHPGGRKIGADHDRRPLAIAILGASGGRRKHQYGRRTQNKNLGFHERTLCFIVTRILAEWLPARGN